MTPDWFIPWRSCCQCLALSLTGPCGHCQRHLVYLPFRSRHILFDFQTVGAGAGAGAGDGATDAGLYPDGMNLVRAGVGRLGHVANFLFNVCFECAVIVSGSWKPSPTPLLTLGKLLFSTPWSETPGMPSKRAC